MKWVCLLCCAVLLGLSVGCATQETLEAIHTTAYAVEKMAASTTASVKAIQADQAATFARLEKQPAEAIAEADRRAEAAEAAAKSSKEMMEVAVGAVKDAWQTAQESELERADQLKEGGQGILQGVVSGDPAVLSTGLLAVLAALIGKSEARKKKRDAILKEARLKREAETGEPMGS